MYLIKRLSVLCQYVNILIKQNNFTDNYNGRKILNQDKVENKEEF